MVTHETVTEAQSTPVEFENSGFTPKRHQMFSVSEEFANATITHHFGFSEETRSGRSHDYRDVIFFGKYQFQYVSRPHENSLRSLAVQAAWTRTHKVAPHGFGAPYRGFPASLAPSNCLKTAKVRRITRKRKTSAFKKLLLEFNNLKIINIFTYLAPLKAGVHMI